MSGTSQSPENLNYSVSAKWWHVSQSLAWQNVSAPFLRWNFRNITTFDCDNIASSTTVRSCNFCPSQYHMEERQRSSSLGHVWGHWGLLRNIADLPFDM